MEVKDNAEVGVPCARDSGEIDMAHGQKYGTTTATHSQSETKRTPTPQISSSGFGPEPARQRDALLSLVMQKADCASPHLHSINMTDHRKPH